jgi:hypothetical protein
LIPKSEKSYETTISALPANAEPQPAQGQPPQAQPGPHAVDNLRRFQQYLQQQQQQQQQHNIPVNVFQQQLQQFILQQQQIQQQQAGLGQPAPNENNNDNDNNIFAQPQGGGLPFGAQPMQTPPSQENIEYLTNMGFPRDEAARALALNQNHIESALTTLLGQ